jgi:RNA polymerase sigma-70 factor (ECF subfamily)
MWSSSGHDTQDLYDELSVRLRGYAVSLSHNRETADDLVQETFIRVMAHLSLLDQLNRHQRKAWVFRTLKNLFLDEVRSRNRRDVLAWDLLQDALLSTGFWTDHLPFDIFEETPERDRSLLRQRYQLGMTSVEIARGMRIRQAAVRSRIHAAIKRLRRRRGHFLEFRSDK